MPPNNRSQGRDSFNNNFSVPVFYKNGSWEDRVLSVCITDTDDLLQVKVRDPKEFSFNYSVDIDLGDFEVIRVNQSLEIGFSEFKVNLIEMFQQYQRKEMLLKCQLTDKKSTLVFYGRSKIKTIVYLTLDLPITNQSEVIGEMMIALQKAQESNANLKRQLANTKRCLLESQEEIDQLNHSQKQVETQLLNDYKKLTDVFLKATTDMEKQIISKILTTNCKVSFLNEEVKVLRHENGLKHDTNSRLLKSLESLKAEVADSNQKLNTLEVENTSLNTLRHNLEKTVADLQKSVHDQRLSIQNLTDRNDDLERDVRKKDEMIVQKQNALDELSKDLVQANGMLVNFNNYYDAKTKEVQYLKEVLSEKEKIMNEDKMRYAELSKKCQLNDQNVEKILADLRVSQNKILQLEEELRKANKINALMTQKVNHGMGFYK